MATKNELHAHYQTALAGRFPRIALRHDRQVPTWSARWHGADGSRPRKDFADPDGDSFAAFTAAFNHLAEIDRAKDAGTYTDPAKGRRRLADYFAEWIEQADIKPTTRASYVDMFGRHVAPTLGARKLSTISRPDVKRWIADMREAGVGARSIGVAHGVLRRLLAEAVSDGILTANPAQGVAVPRRSSREMHPLTGAEVHRLADAVPGRDRALILVLSYAGLRIGEASALRVRNIDLLRSTMHIAGSATEVAGVRHEGSTKTGGARSITLPAFLRDELTAHLAEYADPTDPGAYVFTGPGGQPLRASTWRPRVFNPAQRAAGIDPQRRIHDLRHTAVALAIAAGAHPKLIAEQLGHSRIAVTIDTYGHLFPQLHEALAARLDETFHAAGAGTEGTVAKIGGGA